MSQNVDSDSRTRHDVRFYYSCSRLAVREILHKYGILFSIFLGVIFYSLLAYHARNFDPREVGVGVNTSNVEKAYFGESLVSATEINSQDLLVSAFTLKSQGKKIALWIGASQLYCINRLKEGDRLAVVYANERAQQRHSDCVYMQMAAPNANFNELLAFYLVFLKNHLVPNQIIVAVTYDDLKEEGVRPAILQMISDMPEELAMKGGEGVKNLMESYEALKSQNIDVQAVERNTLTDTPQETLENALSSFMEKIWPSYGRREQTRSWMITAWELSTIELIYRFKGKPVVHIPPDLERWNMDALKSIVRLAKVYGTDILLYKQPYKPGEKSMYVDRKEYDTFHQSLSDWCKETGIHYLDLERIVPDNYWGLTNLGLPDPFHFTDVGHRSLADSIDSFFESNGL